MSIARLVKSAVRRSTWLTCAAYVADDWRARRRLARNDLATRSGARHADLDSGQSIAYIERVHSDYLAYSGRDRLAGTIAEIGPGDNFGVALLLLGGGAQTVHAVDRYRPERDPARQAAIYRALAERHDLAAYFDGAPGDGAIRALVHHVGTPGETFFRDRAGMFDAIVSRAVLEHLYDPLGALDHMARALAPGGVLVHRIDLRDHGMFAGRQPLTFLTVGERVYRRMTRASGRPNRVLLPDWRAWLDRSGLDGTLRITRLAGVAEEVAPASWDELDPALRGRALATVAAIRPRLARRFRAMADEDLAVAGCVLVAEAHSEASSSAKAGPTRDSR